MKLGRAAPVDAAHFTALHSLARTRASWGDLLVTTNGSQAYRRQPSRSDWEIFGPKGGGPISAVASLPNDGLLVARESADPDQRLYRSTDDGANWNAIPLSHLIGQVDLLRAFDPGPIFVLDDVGQIWRADSTNFAPAAPFLARLLDLRTAATLYALAFDHTIQRSTDGGTNWERLSSDLASTEGWREELDRAFSFGVDGTFAWLAAPSAIWTSHDGAATWALALHADSLYSAAAWNADAHELVLGGREVIQTRDEGELFLARSGLDFARTALFDDGAAAALSGGLLMSGDGGATWERWSWDGEADQLASLRAFGRFGFVTRIADTGPSLFVSTNRGRAWSASLDAPRDLREVKRTDDGVWWGAAGGGIYRASDAAPQFKAVSSPLRDRRPRGVCGRATRIGEPGTRARAHQRRRGKLDARCCAGGQPDRPALGELRHALRRRVGALSEQRSRRALGSDPGYQRGPRPLARARSRRSIHALGLRRPRFARGRARWVDLPDGRHGTRAARSLGRSTHPLLRWR
ncbi:MAG: hypothetical protein U0527_12850 [Candidatus Eisenbacteria bacterium]